jgi:hypothetical protein
VPFTGDSFTQTFADDGPGRYSLEVVRTLGGVDYIEDYSSPIWFSAGSGKYKLGKTKLNKKKGTAKQTVEVPGPGPLTLSGKSLKKDKATAGGAGSLKLNVKPKGKLKKKLAKAGKAKVKVEVTFTREGGKPATLTKKLKLKRKDAKKG